MSWSAKESSLVMFSENEMPAVENSFAICKVGFQKIKSTPADGGRIC